MDGGSVTRGSQSAIREFMAAFQRSAMASWAIALREFRRNYGARRLGLFWAFVEPIAYIVVFTVVLSAIRHSKSPLGGPVAPFLTEGLFGFMLFNSIENAVSSGLSSGRSLLAFPRVKPISIFMGRTISEAATVVVVFATLYGSFILLGMVRPPDEPARLLPPLVLAATLGFSMGMFNAVVEELYPWWGSIYKAASRMNIFLSGTMFIADGLPPDVRNILFYAPLIHITEWIRSACHEDYESRFLSESYLIWCTLLTLLTALLLERVLRGRVLAKG